MNGSEHAHASFGSIKNQVSGDQFDTGLKGWIRSLKDALDSSLPQENDYWDVLVQAFLRSQSSDHIKYCLAILRLSMDSLRRVQDRPAQWHVYKVWSESGTTEEYCHIFEIMVLGRYINQVLDCLKGLPHKHLSSWEQHRLGKVPRVWWSILFKSVMAGNNEAVKKAVGSWIMDHYVVQDTSRSAEMGNAELEMFAHKGFFDVFLQWACNGQLAFKGIIREGRSVRCEHGEQLAAWCKAQQEALPAFAQHLLSWLAERADVLNQHTTVYVLAGLCQTTYAPSAVMAQAASKIASGANFSPLCRLITRKYCLRVMEKCVELRRTGQTDGEPGVANLVEAIKRLRQEIQDSRDPVNGDMGIFLSPSTALTQSGERARAVYSKFFELKYIGVDLETFRLHIDWERLVRYDPHQALWRLLAESWQYWIHDMPASDLGAKEHSIQALDFAADCIEKLFDLARKKTYLWTPTAKVLHALRFGDMPEIVEHPKVEAVLLAFINDPPRPTPEHLLDVSVASFAAALDADDMDEYDFQANESIGHAYVFDILNRLRPGDKDWADKILSTLLEPYLEQPLPIHVTSKWKRTSQLQAMIILLGTATLEPEFPDLGLLRSDFEAFMAAKNRHTEEDKLAKERWKRYFDAFDTLIAHDPNPRIRFLLEFAILKLCVMKADGFGEADPVMNPRDRVENDPREFFMLRLERADPANPNPKQLTSWIKIATQLVLYDAPKRVFIEPRTRAVPFTRLLTVLTALVNSPRVPVRFEAQASLTVVCEYARSREYLQYMGAVATVFEGVYNFITRLDKYSNPPEARTLGAFNIGSDNNLATLFEGGYLFIPQEEAPLLYAADFHEIRARCLDGTESSDFRAKRLRELDNEGRLRIGEVDANARALIEKSLGAKRAATTKLTESAHATPIPLQTKSLALDLSSLLPTSEEKEHRNGTGPILIGSLLDAPVNLGGLSRAANVFGCHSLHLPSLSVMVDKGFKSVSVDSEVHLAIESTPPGELVERLRFLKASGWTIVGLEQTSNSVVIGVPSPTSSSQPSQEEQIVRKKLPQKCVIIMGTEATGIPAEVLIECDLCVEIRQWGVTRSLNVQTAAACVLFEWRREWGAGEGV